jgi:aryl-alcohol dehydrogenase-like predicted oxidoreductase
VLAGKYPPNQAPPEGSRLGNGAWFYQDRISQRARQFAVDVAEVASEAGMTLPQLALLWVKEQPGITAPIIGPRTVQHLQEALSIIEARLSADVSARLDELNPPGSVVADFFNTSNWSKMRIPHD